MMSGFDGTICRARVAPYEKAVTRHLPTFTGFFVGAAGADRSGGHFADFAFANTGRHGSQLSRRSQDPPRTAAWECSGSTAESSRRSSDDANSSQNQLSK